MSYQPTEEAKKGEQWDNERRAESCRRLEKQWELKKLELKKSKKK